MEQQMTDAYSYTEAYSRNLGWVTGDEQATLRKKTIAIAGMGGVGGVHLLTLTRLGISNFRIADFDEFGLVNFNRQAGAMMSTLAQPKAAVLAAMAKDINPEVTIEIFGEGVGPDNLDLFLDGADVYVDGLDFFAFAARQATFNACTRKGIPAVTAAPLGMGTAVVNFLPGAMSFEEYFQWGDHSDDEKALRFMVGLAPRMLQDYLADPSQVDLSTRRVSSTIMGCQLCAGAAATEVLKILLGRGNLKSAPHGYHFDAYRNKYVNTWRPWGNRNPIQRLMLIIGRRKLAAMRRGAKS
jgi:molybdopterin/thiamine biosynthesis adenylyltransferase